MKEIKVSIIVPIYNVEKYVINCIQSVMTQTYTGCIECILVDDCSPDCSIKLIENELKRYDGNIVFKILHHEQNRGLSGARNTGIKASTGDYLYFLDSDDEITPDCINLLVAMARKYKDVDFVQGSVVETSPQVKWLDISHLNLPDYVNDKAWIKEHFLEIMGSACNKLIRKEFIINHNLYFKEGIIHEDNHWLLFAYEHLRAIAYCKIGTYCYLIRENSIMTCSYKDKSLYSFLAIADEYINKYSYRDYPKGYRVIVDKLLNNKLSLLKQAKNPKLYNQSYFRFFCKNIYKTNLSFKIRLILAYFLLPSPMVKITVVHFLV